MIFDDFELHSICTHLRLLIEGSGFRRDNGLPDCKGEQDAYVRSIIIDAKTCCESKDSGNVDYLYKIGRNTFTYATTLGEEVTLDWFDGIDPDNFTIPDYEKILSFFQTYEYNRKWRGKYTGPDGLIWCNDGHVFVGGVEMRLLKWDYTSTFESDEERLRVVENLKTPIAITDEEFEKEYKAIRKEY